MPAVLGLWLALAGFQNPPQAAQPSKPSEHFVQSHGIKLHYLDWGGNGEPLLLLTGFGTPADTFQPLALGLREQFHVYALTRRGLTPSDEPQSGYELSMLVADIVAFLDARRLDQVHLVGHSLAGLEILNWRLDIRSGFAQSFTWTRLPTRRARTGCCRTIR